MKKGSDANPDEARHSHEYYHHLSHSKENVTRSRSKPSVSKSTSRQHIKRSQSKTRAGSKKSSYDIPADGLIPARKVSKVADDLIEQVLAKYTPSQKQGTSTSNGNDGSRRSNENSRQSQDKHGDRTTQASVRDQSYQDLVKLGQCLECTWDKNYHPCLLSKPGDNAKCKEEMRKKGYNIEDPKNLCSPHHKSSHGHGHYYESGHFYALNPDSNVDEFHHVFDLPESPPHSRSTSKNNLHSNPSRTHSSHSRQRSSSVDETGARLSRSRSRSSDKRDSKGPDGKNRESLKAPSRITVDKQSAKKVSSKVQPATSPNRKTLELPHAKSGPQRSRSTLKTTSSKSINHVHYDHESKRSKSKSDAGKANKVHSRSSNYAGETVQDKSGTDPDNAPASSSKGDAASNAQDHRKSRFAQGKELDPSQIHINPVKMSSNDIRCNDPNCDPSKFASAGGIYTNDGGNKKSTPARSGPEASPEVKELYTLGKETPCNWGKNYHPCNNRKNEEDAEKCKVWMKEKGLDCNDSEWKIQSGLMSEFSESTSKTNVLNDAKTEDAPDAEKRKS